MFKHPSQKSKVPFPNTESTHFNSTPLSNSEIDFEYFTSLIHKPFSERKHEEQSYLLNFLSDFSAIQTLLKFSKNKQDTLIQISKCIKHKLFYEGDAISSTGDFSDKVYMILKGSAIAYAEISSESPDNKSKTSPLDITTDEGVPSEEQTLVAKLRLERKSSQKGLAQLFRPKMELRKLRKNTTLGSLNSSEQMIFVEQSPSVVESMGEVLNFKRLAPEYQVLAKANANKPGKYIKRGSFAYRPKRKLPQGSYFGEVGILTANLREWTYIAAEETQVLSIDAQDYLAIFKERLQQLSQNVAFIKPFFPQAPELKLSKLCYLFEEYNLPCNTILFEDGQDIDGFYLIKEGQVQLFKSFQTASSTKASESRISPPKIRQKCMVAKIKEGEALGEVDFFNQAKRELTAIVTSITAVLLKIKLEIYEELHPSYQTLFDSLKKASILKHYVRNEKIKQYRQGENSPGEVRSIFFEQDSFSRQKGGNLPSIHMHKQSEPNIKQSEIPSFSVYQKIRERREMREPKFKELNQAGPKGYESHQSLKQNFMALLSPEDAKRVLRVEKAAKRVSCSRKRGECSCHEDKVKEHREGEEKSSYPLYLSRLDQTRNLYDQKSLLYKPIISDDSERQLMSSSLLYCPMLKLKQESFVQAKPINPFPKNLIKRKMKYITENQLGKGEETSLNDPQLFRRNSVKSKFHLPKNKSIIEENSRLIKDKKQITVNSIVMTYEEVNKILNNEESKKAEATNGYPKCLEKSRVRRKLKRINNTPLQGYSSGQSYDFSKSGDEEEIRALALSGIQGSPEIDRAKEKPTEKLGY